MDYWGQSLLVRIASLRRILRPQQQRKGTSYLSRRRMGLKRRKREGGKGAKVYVVKVKKKRPFKIEMQDVVRLN